MTTSPLAAGTLTADVEFSTGMALDTVTRCVCFRLFDCASQPTEVCVDVPVTNGFADDVVVPVPDGGFVCAEARDPIHTLRSMSLLVADGNDFEANFVGDPNMGGNWLVLGNLNDDELIDVLDVGAYKYEIQMGSSYPGRNTTCLTPGPHGDVNGDGLVDNADHFHIAFKNFLMAAKLGCWELVCDCPDPEVDTDGDTVPDCVDLCPDVDDTVFGPECADGIPATSEWGLIVLAMCLLVAGKIYFGRPHVAI